MHLKNSILAILVVAITLLITACSGKQAYHVSRTLLGYIPPPEVPSVMEQLKEELLRCEKSGGSECEKQAVKYVRTVNESLKRKPMKGVVIIRRVESDGEIQIDYNENEEFPITVEDTEEK